MAALVRLLPLMATERSSVTIAFVAVIISSLAGLVGPLIIAHTIDTYIRSGDFGGVLRFAGASARRLPCGVRLDLRPDADDGQRRTPGAVRACEIALFTKIAGSAARLLQSEQGRRPHLANQQRHRQAEPVFRAESGAAGGQPVHDGGRGDLSGRSRRAVWDSPRWRRRWRLRADAAHGTVGASSGTSRACSRSAP